MGLLVVYEQFQSCSLARTYMITDNSCQLVQKIIQFLPIPPTPLTTTRFITPNHIINQTPPSTLIWQLILPLPRIQLLLSNTHLLQKITTTFLFLLLFLILLTTDTKWCYEITRFQHIIILTIIIRCRGGCILIWRWGWLLVVGGLRMFYRVVFVVGELVDVLGCVVWDLVHLVKILYINKYI